MKDLGIEVHNDTNQVSFDADAWTRTGDIHTDASGMEYVEMHNETTDMTVLVQQHILANQG